MFLIGYYIYVFGNMLGINLVEYFRMFKSDESFDFLLFGIGDIWNFLFIVLEFY